MSDEGFLFCPGLYTRSVSTIYAFCKMQKEGERLIEEARKGRWKKKKGLAIPESGKASFNVEKEMMKLEGRLNKEKE